MPAKPLPLIVPLTGITTTLELVSVMDAPSLEQAQDARRSLLNLGYSCSAVGIRETPAGRVYTLHGTKSTTGEVLL